MKILEMTQIITFSDAVIAITINVCAKFENSPFSAFWFIMLTPFIYWAVCAFNMKP